jgi:hypothetical protein
MSVITIATKGQTGKATLAHLILAMAGQCRGPRRGEVKDNTG